MGSLFGLYIFESGSEKDYMVCMLTIMDGLYHLSQLAEDMSTDKVLFINTD